MSTRINNNISAMNSQRQLGMNNLELSKSLEKLSSGLRINRAADDAAGLSISERMRVQVRGLGQASRNAQDGISLANVAESALNEVTSMLQRMRELALQAANGTMTTSDRANADAEFQQLIRQIDQIGGATRFNGMTLYAASGAGVLTTFQVGAYSGDVIGFCVGSLSSAAVGSIPMNVAAFSINTQSVNSVLVDIESAIAGVAAQRSTLGAISNRLEYTINNVDTVRENVAAAESRIRDADMAYEMTRFTRNQILSQSAQSMLAQANQVPQGVLSLLQ
jgi:flagellin